MSRSRTPHAFTIVDLLAVVVVITILVLIFVPGFGSRNREAARRIRDATQVRGINQGMCLWRPSNNDEYPLPSLIDTADHTVTGPPAAKDTTANIMSILVYSGFLTPEILVSPAESNPNIRAFDKYEHSKPHSAANPEKALWDPALNADFTKGTGHISYAHLLPTGERRAAWSNTFKANEAVVGNRGPEIDAVTYNDKGDPTPHRVLRHSNTDLIHGGRNSWEGNICYNDNHVNFETALAPPGVVWLNADKKPFGDVLFHAEPKDPTKADAFLSIFVKAGPTPSDFKAIWD